MPSYVTRDFHCDECGTAFEEMITREEDAAGTYPCACGALASRQLSVPRIGAYSAMSADARMNHLKTRSENHSKQELKKNHEKFGLRKKK